MHRHLYGPLRRVKFLLRENAFAINIELIEEGAWRGGEFVEIDAALLLEIHQWRCRRLIRRESLRVHRPRLVLVQATFMFIIGRSKIGAQSGLHPRVGDGAILTGVLDQHVHSRMPLPCVLALMRWLTGTTGESKCEKNGSAARGHTQFFSFPKFGQAGEL